jgi:hypothetical protein
LNQPPASIEGQSKPGQLTEHSYQHESGKTYSASTIAEIGVKCTGMAGKSPEQISRLMRRVELGRQKLEAQALEESIPEKPHVPKPSTDKQTDKHETTAKAKERSAVEQFQSRSSENSTKESFQSVPAAPLATEDYRDKARRIASERLAGNEQRQMAANMIREQIEQLHVGKEAGSAKTETIDAPGIADELASKARIIPSVAPKEKTTPGILSPTVPAAKPKPSKATSSPMLLVEASPVKPAILSEMPDHHEEAIEEAAPTGEPFAITNAGFKVESQPQFPAELDPVPTMDESLEVVFQPDFESAGPSNLIMTEQGLSYLTPEELEDSRQYAASEAEAVEIEQIDPRNEYVLPTLEDTEGALALSDSPRPIRTPELREQVQPAIKEFVRSLKAMAEIANADEAIVDAGLTSASIEVSAALKAINPEELEAVLIELFEDLAVAPTPEAIRAFIRVLEAAELENVLQAEGPQEVDKEYLSKRIGTAEFRKQFKQAVSTIQQTAARAYSLGTSILRVSGFVFTPIR